MKRIQIILIIGLIHGLIYAFVMPPWQHYDEPGHFEYVWLIANRLRLPHQFDYDQNMRLAVGKSLIASSFFAPENQPNLTDPTKPIWIGMSQLADPPLYYFIEAIPFFLLKGSPIDLQLYVGRIVSLLFLLLTIYSSYKLTQELTPTDHPLQWMVPIFIALLPAFVEFMTSINNYVAAIGLFSLWLLVSVKLIKRFSFRYTALLIILTVASILTQNVLYPVLLYLPIVLLLSIFPRKIKYFVWILTLIASFATLFIVFNWNDAAFWLRGNYQDLPPRVQLKVNNDNTNVLRGQVYPDATWGQNYPAWNSGFFQLVPSEIGHQLQGKTVTIGAWVWSDRHIHGYGPGVNALFQFQDQWFGFRQEFLDETPKFIASVIQLPEQQERVQVWLRTTSVESQDATIFFSGVVLAEGEWPVDTSPQFSDKDGSFGIWGNRPFVNLIRNAQFQHAWPFLRPKLLRLVISKIQGLTPVHISSFLSLFLDIPGTSWYTKYTGEVLFRTFWAKFGWGQVPLISTPLTHHPYRPLLIITFLGIFGALLTGFHLVKIRKHEFTFLSIVIVITVLAAVIYGAYAMGGALRFRAYIPTTRYIFPAILPISLILVIGWQGLLAWAVKIIKLPSRLGPIIYLGFLISLDFYSIVSILIFFKKT